MKKLLLASGSPRRKELLDQVGFSFTVKKSNVDETRVKEQDPRKLVEYLAELKGNAITLGKEEVVLSADTVVSYNGKVLTKPNDQAEAMEMLRQLNGTSHMVYTGVMIKSLKKSVVFSTVTSVQFWEHSEADLLAYIQSGEPFDKAGGYGIQGKGAVLVKEIKGDYYNVMGLPISTVVRELKEFGVDQQI